METLLKDLRYALRGFRDRPGFTAAAVASLVLGIGLNTVIFGLVNSVLLRPLPVEKPNELVSIYTNDGQSSAYSTTSYLDYLDLQAGNGVLRGLAGHSLMFAALSRDDASELAFGEVVTANYFDVLGVRPVLGRAFLAEEDTVEKERPVVILSHGFWTRRYGADPAAVGKALRLRGMDFTIVGVAPRGFHGMTAGAAPDLWVPSAMVEEVEPVGMQDVTGAEPGKTRREQRGRRWMFLTGRLEPGVTAEEARANLGLVMARLEREHPATNEGRRVSVIPTNKVRIHPALDSSLGPAGAVLMAVVALVLLVACANVANMLLARATARRKEIGVRLAIGASRSRLVRQLLTESLLLSLAAGAVALLAAYWANEALGAWQPPVPVKLALDLQLDLSAFLFTLGVSAVAAVLFGLAPALRATRPNLVASLKSEGAAAEAGRRFALRDALVVGQVAVTLFLLVLAGLLLRSMGRSLAADLGFRPEKLAFVTFDLGSVRYTEEQGKAFYRTLIERVRALPEVEAASYSERLPFTFNNHMTAVFIEGQSSGPDDDGVSVDVTNVSPGYFETLGVPLLYGRDIVAEDQRVVVVNQTFAEKFWPGEEALGKRFSTLGPAGPFYEVVGVAANHKVRTVGEPPRPFVHFVRDRRYTPSASLVARGRGDGLTLAATLRKAVLAVEPQLLILESQSMEGSIAHTVTPARLGSVLFGSFGALALLLAALGLYGVVSYAVGRRTREIGIRQAMGARPADLVRMVLGQGLKLVAIGLGIGLLAAVGATMALSKVFFGLGAVEAQVYLGAAALLAAVAFVANLVPARRAARLDPLAALREG